MHEFVNNSMSLNLVNRGPSIAQAASKNRKLMYAGRVRFMALESGKTYSN